MQEEPRIEELRRAAQALLLLLTGSANVPWDAARRVFASGDRLAALLADENDNYDSVTQGQALAQLRRIDAMMAAPRQVSPETQAHREHVRFLIERALDAD